MTFQVEFREIYRRHGVSRDERNARDEDRAVGPWCNSQLGSQGSGRLASSPCLALGFVNVVPSGSCKRVGRLDRASLCVITQLRTRPQLPAILVFDVDDGERIAKGNGTGNNDVSADSATVCEVF